MPIREKIKAGAIGVGVLAFFAYVGTSCGKKPAPIVFKNEPAKETPSSPPASEPKLTELVVHVAGAVKKPGVYKLPLGARVHDAIRTAGGAKVDANLDEWNLAAKVTDGIQVYVNTKAATKVAANPKSSSPGRPRPLSGIMPMRVNVPESMRGGIGPTSVEPEPTTEKKPSSRSAKKEAPADGSISLNTADSTQLQMLPGVGPSTAEKILDYRKQQGGFTSIDELLAVKGIGPKKLEAMRKFLRL